MFMKQIMLKNFLLIVIVMQILPIFAQKKYTSADGFYGYNFSEDYTQMSSTIIDSEISIDNSIENQTEITHLRKSIIPFWKIGSIEYIYFESDFYFILQGNYLGNTLFYRCYFLCSVTIFNKQNRKGNCRSCHNNQVSYGCIHFKAKLHNKKHNNAYNQSSKAKPCHSF